MIELIKQLNYKFDFDRVRYDVYGIIEKYKLPQIGLTHTKNKLTEEEKIIESVGSIKNYETGEFKFQETDFVVFNEAFKNTYLYEMYKAIPSVGRFRIMTMDGPSCYTIHRDLSKRYHYVVETNQDCLFLFPGRSKMMHIPCDNNVYLIDTRFKHTFVNGSRSRRIHIVLDDLSTLKL